MKKNIFFLTALCLAITLTAVGICGCGSMEKNAEAVTASDKYALDPKEGETATAAQLEAWTKINDVTKTVEKDGAEHTLSYYKYTRLLTQFVFYVDEETKEISDVQSVSLKRLPESERLDPSKNYGEINYEKNKDNYTNWITKPEAGAKNDNKKDSSGHINNNQSKDYNLSEDFNDWPEDDFADEIEAEEYWEDYYDYEENDWDWDE